MGSDRFGADYLLPTNRISVVGISLWCELTSKLYPERHTAMAIEYLEKASKTSATGEDKTFDLQS